MCMCIKRKQQQKKKNNNNKTIGILACIIKRKQEFIATYQNKN